MDYRHSKDYRHSMDYRHSKDYRHSMEYRHRMKDRHRMKARQIGMHNDVQAEAKEDRPMLLTIHRPHEVQSVSVKSLCHSTGAIYKSA